MNCFCCSIPEAVSNGLHKGGHKCKVIHLDKDGFDPVMREKDLKAFGTAGSAIPLRAPSSRVPSTRSASTMSDGSASTWPSRAVTRNAGPQSQRQVMQEAKKKQHRWNSDAASLKFVFNKNIRMSLSYHVLRLCIQAPGPNQHPEESSHTRHMTY